MTPNPEKEAKHSTPLHEKIAEWGLIFECVAGSKLVGINVDDSDDDRLGVCIEPPEYTVGLRKFEQYVGRSSPMGERTGAGGTDKVIYSLRKWASLALSGNPSVLQLLYVPTTMVTDWGPHENWFVPFQKRADIFQSRKAGAAFLGYMKQQRERLEGTRGQKNVKRPELEERFGFDTKYAGHIIRLGWQGVQYLTDGYLTLPLPQFQRDEVLAIRRGQWTKQDVLNRAKALEEELLHLYEGASTLPDEPDYDAVNRLVAGTYRQFYDFKGWRFE